MAHRLLATFPRLNNLAFLDLNRFEAQLSALTNQPMNRNIYLQKLESFYQQQATDADFVLTDKAGNEQEQVDENTDSLFFNTGLMTTDGHALWADCRVNYLPDKSKFFAIRLEPRFAVVENGHALLQRFPSVNNLVFIDAPAYLISNLQHLCQLSPGTTSDQVMRTMDETYRALKDEDLVFLHCGKPASDADADELRLPTGFTDSTGAPVIMSCQRNPVEGRQPWKKQRYMLHVEHYTHRFRAQYPILFGTDHSCFAFMSSSAADGFNTVMRSRVDNIPNIRVEDFVSRMNGIYAKAKDEDIVLQDQDRQPVEELRDAKYCIIHTDLTSDRKQVSIMLERNFNANRQPFAGPRMITAGEYFPGVDPRDYLENFASIPDYHTLCEIVAQKAAPEPWSFRGDGHYEILESYLRYSTYRLIQDNSMVMDRNRGVCVMNTGLVNRAFYDICLIFRRDVSDPNSRWQYHTVDSITNINNYSTSGFAKPILAPHYWDDTGELVYKLRYDKKVDDQVPQFNEDHIILERLHRLPKDFLENAAYRMDDDRFQRFRELINTPNFGPGHAPNFGPGHDAWTEAVQMVRADVDLFREIRTRIENAVRDAIRRQRSNYKTIIPCFYPRANELCFLLPLLTLTRNAASNPALVLVSLDGGRTFYGKTILSMDMVYKNSRLICRPEADWINFQDIIPTNDED